MKFRILDFMTSNKGTKYIVSDWVYILKMIGSKGTLNDDDDDDDFFRLSIYFENDWS